MDALCKTLVNPLVNMTWIVPMITSGYLLPLCSTHLGLLYIPAEDNETSGRQLERR